MDPSAALDRAAELALRGRGDVEPNPCVGAVVVRDGQIIGEGWHQAWGGPHAEVLALAAAGSRARGAGLFVTLEPCCTHGKTPPCTDALLAAGLSSVVVGSRDPDPRHAGRGLSLLSQAGLTVECVDHGPSVALAQRFARGLIRRRPHVFAKWAQSVEGALAGPGRSTVRLTCPASDSRVHTWRAHLDALLVGVGTVIADDPALTARGPERATRPLRRIVLDPHLRTPLGCKLVTGASETATWIVTRDDADQQPQAVLEAEGARVLRVPEDPQGGPHGWLAGALTLLATEGVGRLMVEGGAQTLAGFLDGRLVDQVAVFLTPVKLGPLASPLRPGRPAADEASPIVLAHALELEDSSVERLGADLLLRGWCRSDSA